MKNFCRVYALLLLILSNARDCIAADLVIFSYKRPLQLYALLESIVHNVQGLGQIAVVYRADDEEYEQAYQLVQDDFYGIEFLKQDKGNPETDFKQLTLQGSFDSHSEYILFAVDDMIVTDTIDIDECIDLLEKTSAYAFYLRLGKNITFDYLSDKSYPYASGKSIKNSGYIWHFAQGKGAWCYPNTVDMTLYRKSDIETFLKTRSYTNPNELEACWARTKKTVMGKTGICFEHSRVINVPANRVQTTFANKNMKSFSAERLLSLFNEGYKIDIKSLQKINNTSTHVPYTFEFCKR